MNYFDELEIHPVELDASKDEKAIIETIVQELGKPNNYGPTPEELEEVWSCQNMCCEECYERAARRNVYVCVREGEGGKAFWLLAIKGL